jgi:hypothetical protein
MAAAGAKLGQRPVQVTVWGASGFTGRLVCEHLVQNYQVGAVLLCCSTWGVCLGLQLLLSLHRVRLQMGCCSLLFCYTITVISALELDCRLLCLCQIQLPRPPGSQATSSPLGREGGGRWLL